jgi:hypothetical protein
VFASLVATTARSALTATRWSTSAVCTWRVLGMNLVESMKMLTNAFMTTGTASTTTCAARAIPSASCTTRAASTGSRKSSRKPRNSLSCDCIDASREERETMLVSRSLLALNAWCSRLPVGKWQRLEASKASSERLHGRASAKASKGTDDFNLMHEIHYCEQHFHAFFKSNTIFFSIPNCPQDLGQHGGPVGVLAPGVRAVAGPALDPH